MSFFESLLPDEHGRASSDAAGNGNLGYGHFSQNRDAAGNTRGISTGAGLYHGPGALGSNVDLASANLNFGGWRGSDGRTNVGFEADAQLAKFGIDPGGALGNWGVDAGALDASAGGYFNDSDASLGATANLVDGALSYHRQDASSSSDRGMRVGGSVGVGLGGRLHYGDADHDGHREYGFGFDAGPLSFDYKTETPLGDLATAPLLPVNMLMSSIGLGDYSPGALVDKGIHGIGSAISSVFSW